MSNFAIQCSLKAPVMMGMDSQLTLDGVLSALLYQESGDPEAAIRDIPLDQVDGIWCGSIAFFSSLVDTDETVLKRGLTISDLTEDRIDYAARKGKNMTFVEQKKGDYMAIINPYRIVHAEYVIWFGRGDQPEVTRLMERLHHVGKKGGLGFGWVGDVRVTEMDEDYSWAMPDPNHQGRHRAMRPIPLTMWDKGKWNVV